MEDVFYFREKSILLERKAMNLVTVTGLINTAEGWSPLIGKNLECFSILIKIPLATLTGHMLQATQRYLMAVKPQVSSLHLLPCSLETTAFTGLYKEFVSELSVLYH